MDHISQFRRMLADFLQANQFQVFSPVALSIAYFSMPDLPFKPSTGVFWIACVLVIVVVRLLFDVLGGKIQETWWCRAAKKAVAWFLEPSHSIDETPPTTNKFGDYLPRSPWRRHNPMDPSLEGTEMVGFGV